MTAADDAGMARLYAELTTATEQLIDAEAAHLVALTPDGPLATEAVNLANALLGHARATLAVQLANGSVAAGAKRIASLDHWSDGDWIPMVGGCACDALPGETASAQALRLAAESDLLGSDRTWRVLVWTDPRPDAEPDGEWTNLTDRGAVELAAA